MSITDNSVWSSVDAHTDAWPKTLWIGLEGIGGAGKTTQLERLGRALREQYPDRVVATDGEFGDSPLGAYVSGATGNGRLRLAFHGADTDTGHVRHLLALAARAEKLRCAARRRWDVILLDAGTAVDVAHALADVPSAAGPVRRWLREAVESLLAPAAEAIGPGVTAFLHCRPELAAERLAGRLLRRPTAAEVTFLRRLAEAYEEVLADRDHVIRVDAEPAPEEVTAQLLTAVKPLLG